MIEELLKFRRMVAMELILPPHRVFSDPALRAMLSCSSMDDLHKIPEIPHHTISIIGGQILAVLSGESAISVIERFYP